MAERFILDEGFLKHTAHTTLLMQDVIASPRQQDSQQHPALIALVNEAESFLPVRPPAVTEKTMVPASDDIHDYISLSIYLWPHEGWTEPHTYYTRDGYINPECLGSDYDRSSMHTLVYLLQTLSFAYAFTGDERYAEKAASLLRMWYVDSATRMNPNMKYAQYIPGRLRFDTVFPPLYVPGVGGTGQAEYFSKLCGGLYVSSGGVIEATAMVTIPDCATILSHSPHWTETDMQSLRAWFGEFVVWLRDSVYGWVEGFQPGNHGSWYWSYMAVFSEFAGMHDYAREILNTKLPERISQQIMPDGMVEDVGRSRSFDYAVFTVTSFLNAALAGERIGIDLWSFSIDGVAKIPQAIGWIANHLGPGKTWPRESLGGVTTFRAVPMLTAAAHRLGKEEYLSLIEKFEDYPVDHRNRLLYPSSR